MHFWSTMTYNRICLRLINEAIMRLTSTSFARSWGVSTRRSRAGTRSCESASLSSIGWVCFRITLNFIGHGHWRDFVEDLTNSSKLFKQEWFQSECGYISKRDFQYVLRELGDITDSTIIDEIFNEVDFIFFPKVWIGFFEYDKGEGSFIPTRCRMKNKTYIKNIVTNW